MGLGSLSWGSYTDPQRFSFSFLPQQFDFFKCQHKEIMKGANGQTVLENETGDPQVVQ